jgi:hypothetical protein
VPFDRFNQLPAKPEHVAKVTALLRSTDFLTPRKIASATFLSLTQVNCALDAIDEAGHLEIRRQSETPRVSVRIKSDTEDRGE